MDILIEILQQFRVVYADKQKFVVFIAFVIRHKVFWFFL